MQQQIEIKGRAGEYQYGRVASNHYVVIDRRTGKQIPTNYPLRHYNDASSLACRLHQQERAASAA